MAGDIHGYTVLSALSLAGGSSRGTLATNGGQVSLGGGILSLGTHSFSITTASAMDEIPDGHVGIVFQASGLSLIYRSGDTAYTVGASATSAAIT